MKFSPRILILFLLSLFPAKDGFAKNERWYQKVWCDGSGGIMEVELPDGSRVDCLTNTHAIEMDFARKWPEAIGQSLYYAYLTGQRAGIVLILRSHNDTPHLRAARTVIETYQLPITIWPLGP